MSEMNGHYARGRWVPEPAPATEVKPEFGAKPDSIPDGHVPTPMNEMNGHYEHGRWVPEPAPAAEAKSGPATPQEPGTGAESGSKSKQTTPTIEAQLHEASLSVRKAVNDVMNAGHRLLGTPEGHEQIEQAARKAGEDLERAINGWAEAARRALQRS